MFAILMAILQQAGPQIIPQLQQLLISPAFAQGLRQILLNPAMRFLLIRLINEFPEMMSRWYQSLSYEDQERLKRLGIWVLKDFSGGIATSVIGLPVGPIVEKGIDWAFSDQNH